MILVYNDVRIIKLERCMYMLTKRFFEKGEDSRMFFRVSGSFGEMVGELSRDENTVFKKTDKYIVSCSYKSDEYGVITRKDVFKNTSDEKLTLTSLKSRFVFEGGEYDVYTQYNNWQSESIGAWQPLVTGVTASVSSTRSTQNASPFVVLWSRQQNKGAVIHLLPNCSWEIKVTRIGLPQRLSKVLVELGPSDYDFNLEVQPNEKILLPEIICYETANKLDFDCYKLHNYMHLNYPRREMPIIYNTWMYKYTHFTPELLLKQAELASEMGIEYFVIDAGWFGREGIGWFAAVGDWEENPVGGFKGTMKEFADKIRKMGLKFGFWIEPERASPVTNAIKDNPEYYIKSNSDDMYYLDFGNQEAREWMLDKITVLINTYGIKYIKFDYNADLFYDERKSAFYHYHQGFDIFMKELRKLHPDVYFTGCAGGGERTELLNYTRYDSFWPSDNESPYSEMRMYKETILRLPPQGFERWTCVHSLEKYEDFYEPFSTLSYKPTGRMVACCDAWWYDIAGVHPSYLDAYQTCGPIGFSCDLTRISEADRLHFKEFIKDVKNKRGFWKNAVARIICDTESVTVYQYSDMSLSDIVVQVVSNEALQNSITVYPVVCENETYILNGETKLSGKEILEEGIEVPVNGWKEMSQITLNIL